MKTCPSCPYPGKCKAAGKCLKAPKDNKTMGSKKVGYGK